MLNSASVTPRPWSLLKALLESACPRKVTTAATKDNSIAFASTVVTMLASEGLKMLPVRILLPQRVPFHAIMRKMPEKTVEKTVYVIRAMANQDHPFW